MKIAVLGGGSFGTALAHVLACAGNSVTILLRDIKLAEDINVHHENTRYLAGMKIHASVQATCDPSMLQYCDCWLIALPCQMQEKILVNYLPYFTDTTMLINVAKGIVLDKQMPLSMLIPPLFGLPTDSARYAVLSGPSFAKEVIQEKPSACVLACEDETNAERLRSLFSTSFFRCYSSTDVIGLELGGAIKNVIAIAAGICDGLDYGHNARAALITRGLAEISRLGTTMGAGHATFMGLSGLGDLMLTCTGDLSRNRQVGLRLGKGERLHDIIQSMNGVAEGVPTTHAVKKMAIDLGVEMPIACAVDAILNEEISPNDGLRTLMERALKAER